MKLNTVLVAAGFKPYTGSSAFIGRAFEQPSTGIRFFVRGAWADMRGGNVTSMLAAGMVLDQDFRVGGTAGGNVQVKWDAETLIKLQTSDYSPVFKASKVAPVVEAPPSEEEVEEMKLLLAASK